MSVEITLTIYFRFPLSVSFGLFHSVSSVYFPILQQSFSDSPTFFFHSTLFVFQYAYSLNKYHTHHTHTHTHTNPKTFPKTNKKLTNEFMQMNFGRQNISVTCKRRYLLWFVRLNVSNLWKIILSQVLKFIRRGIVLNGAFNSRFLSLLLCSYCALMLAKAGKRLLSFHLIGLTMCQRFSSVVSNGSKEPERLDALKNERKI